MFEKKLEPNRDYDCRCTNWECDWNGKLSETETDIEQDGWENPPYVINLCPKCGEVVEV